MGPRCVKRSVRIDSRRQPVENFGTIKAWMGATHFQMRRLSKLAGEMALHVPPNKRTSLAIAFFCFIARSSG